jgi:hypothetical protein
MIMVSHDRPEPGQGAVEAVDGKGKEGVGWRGS